MLEWLWGFKTVAALDAWTLEHIIGGLSVGHAVKKTNRKHVQKHYPGRKIKLITLYRMDILFILFLAFAWEAIEHYLEKGLAGEIVGDWFWGVEFWPNRLIMDPLMLVLGYMLAKKYPVFVWPARFFSIIWFAVHIFVFPHSMYLHAWFG